MTVSLADVISTLRKHGETKMARELNSCALTIPFIMDADDFDFDDPDNDFDGYDNFESLQKDNEVDWDITGMQESGLPIDGWGNDMILKIPVVDENE